jgi:outer membrane receptor for ferrienterochelin and colicins
MALTTLALVVALAAPGDDADTADAGAPAPEVAQVEVDIADLDLQSLLDQDIRAQKVTAVSRREETVGDAPATVSVISHDDFARHDWRNVAEALRSVPGLYVSWGREYYATGVRGLSAPGDIDTRILVLVDGHTLNNPWSSQSNTGELLALPPEAIERIEVIRGPASSVYGSNAFFAVVNIVPRKPSDEVPQRLVVDLLASSTNLHRLTLAGHTRFSFGLQLSAFAEGLFGNGPAVHYEDLTRPRLNLGVPTPTAGHTFGTDYEHGSALGLTLEWKGVYLTGQLHNRRKGLPGAPGDAIFDDPYNSVGDRNVFAELGYRNTFGPHAVSVRAFYDRFRSLRALHRDPSDWESGAWKWGDPRVVSEGNADKYGGEAQGTFSFGDLDTLIAGVEVTGTVITQPTYELDPTTSLADPTTVTGGAKDAAGNTPAIVPLNFAAYLQNDLRPHRRFGLVVGLRYDVNTVFYRPSAPLSALAPRATAIYKPLDELTLKLGYGEAFRYPTVFEAFFDDASSVCGNSAVTPERQRTAELSAVYNLLKAWNLSGSLYFTQVQGLLVRQTIDPCYVGSGARQQFVNAGNVLVFGAEAALDVRLQSVTAFATVSASHATQTIGTQTSRPANSPTLVAGAGVAVPVVPDRVFGSLRAHLLTGRLDWSLDPSRAVPAALRLEGSLTGRKVWQGLLFGATGIVQLKVGPDAPGFREAASRDPVTGADSVAGAVPQNLVEVRAHVGYEL